MKHLKSFELFENVDSYLLKQMRSFGLSKSDIDSDGYIRVYHGGVTLPKRLNKNEIFFITQDYKLAEDYARIRKGEVFELRVKPEDVNFNQGSYEIEYNLGGIITNDGRIIPPEPVYDYVIKSIEDIKKEIVMNDNITDRLLRWVISTIIHYMISVDYKQAYIKLMKDIEYYEYLYDDDMIMINFSNEMGYSKDIDRLQKDLSDLSILDIDELFDKSENFNENVSNKKIYTGKEVVAEFVSWGEGHGDKDHTEYLSDRIMNWDYTKELVSIEELLERDVDLRSFIEGLELNDGEYEEDNIIDEDWFNDCYECPIIIASWEHTTEAVIDGYHRIAQHIRNSENDIEAYRWIKE